MTPEGRVVKYLVDRCQAYGFSVRKVSWEGRRYAPDRLILGRQAFAFVECKAPGQKPTAGQLREFERLRASAMPVFVCDSQASVDEAVEWVKDSGNKNG